MQNIVVCKSINSYPCYCITVLEPSSVDGVVPVEHNIDDEHAHNGKEKIAEDSSESPVDLDQSDKGNIQIMRPQRYFIVRVPKLAGDELWDRVQDAQAHLDRLTQERDAVNVRKKKQKVKGLQMFKSSFP